MDWGVSPRRTAVKEEDTRYTANRNKEKYLLSMPSSKIHFALKGTTGPPPQAEGRSRPHCVASEMLLFLSLGSTWPTPTYGAASVQVAPPPGSLPRQA